MEVKALREQLEEAREQFRRRGEERNCLQALLDLRAQEGRKSQELLQQKDEELQLRQQEAQQVRDHTSLCRNILFRLHINHDPGSMKLH